MAILKFANLDKEEELPDGSPIAEACEQEGVPFACTEGLCGTCIVEVVEGHENLSKPNQQEIDFLGEEGTETERMACQCKINSGCVTIRF